VNGELLYERWRSLQNELSDTANGISWDALGDDDQIAWNALAKEVS
jgi:hypothetical protein